MENGEWRMRGVILVSVAIINYQFSKKSSGSVFGEVAVVVMAKI
jgi:hypothetical protein